MSLAKGLLLLLAVLLVERGLHRPRTLDYRRFEALIENPDCAPWG